MSDGEDALIQDVFINCPFDAGYAATFEALVFTIRFLGFIPRSAREMQDSGEPRIEKLFRIIEECRFGIHDLSRTELDPVHGLPRFNMPFELSVFLGAKRYGLDRQREKRCLILDTDPFRYQRFLSDLAGMDIEAHRNDPHLAMRRLRDWLAIVSRRKLQGADRLIASFDRFTGSRLTMTERLGFDAADAPYSDFEQLVMTWLLDEQCESAGD